MTHSRNFEGRGIGLPLVESHVLECKINALCAKLSPDNKNFNISRSKNMKT